jgi:preprotein translocase subunit SecG
MTVLLYFAMTAFVLVCVILILLILIQKGRGGGLASAFGGAGGQTAFGSKTGDVLTWATSVVFAVFVVLAVVLNLISNHIDATRNKAAAAIPVMANQPAPAAPSSSLPEAPTGEPGIANPPVLPSAGPTTLPAVQSLAPANGPANVTIPNVTVPAVPTTLPAAVQHVVNQAANSLPTTRP